MYNNQKDSLFGNMLIVQAYRPEFNAHHSCKKLGMVAHTWNPSLGRQKQADLWCLQAIQPHLPGKLQPAETLVPPKGEQYLKSKPEGRPV